MNAMIEDSVDIVRLCEQRLTEGKTILATSLELGVDWDSVYLIYEQMSGGRREPLKVRQPLKIAPRKRQPPKNKPPKPIKSLNAPLAPPALPDPVQGLDKGEMVRLFTRGYSLQQIARYASVSIYQARTTISDAMTDYAFMKSIGRANQS